MQSMGVHPIVMCADLVEAALKDVAGVDPGFMRAEEKAAALRRLHRVESQVCELRLRVMAASGEVAEATADHSVATWLASETRSDPRAQAGDLALARGLERRWTRLRESVAAGAVNLAQARVIVQALEDLPAGEVGAEAVVRAEEALIGYAAEHGPRELRRLGRRILEVAAPGECGAPAGRRGRSLAHLSGRLHLAAPQRHRSGSRRERGGASSSAVRGGVRGVLGVGRPGSDAAPRRGRDDGDRDGRP
jgi:hypothetical protein